MTFQITQHCRDSLILQKIVDYLSCGRVALRSTKLANDYLVTTLADIESIIIPFFQKYPLLSVKQLNYLDFCCCCCCCKVAKIIKNKEHLTIEGLNKIKNIKQGMNNKRII